jgi:predicted enzyme related to lactoylglutathione lyase
MTNALCHFEFMTGNVDSTRSFYSAIFGWKFDDHAVPGYTLIHTGHEPTGGMFPKPDAAPSSCMNVYFTVPSIDDTLKAVKANGGQVLVPKTAVPNVGHLAMFMDPEGIAVGLMQPA